MDFIVPTNSLVSPNPVKSSPDRRLVTALSYHITYGNYKIEQLTIFEHFSYTCSMATVVID